MPARRSPAGRRAPLYCTDGDTSQLAARCDDLKPRFQIQCCEHFAASACESGKARTSRSGSGAVAALGTPGRSISNRMPWSGPSPLGQFAGTAKAALMREGAPIANEKMRSPNPPPMRTATGGTGFRRNGGGSRPRARNSSRPDSARCAPCRRSAVGARSGRSRAAACPAPQEPVGRAT